MPYKDNEKEKERCRLKYVNNRSRIRAKAKEDRKAAILADPVGMKIFEQNRALKSNFGITLDDYMRMLEEQGGVCSICRKPPVRERLCVDHDHSCCSGVRTCGRCIRGLICRRCNSMLGFVDDNVDRLRSAIAYIERWIGRVK